VDKMQRTRTISTCQRLLRGTSRRANSSYSASGYMQTGRPLKDPETRILVTGASGQIGVELVPRLRQRYGKENVIASDVKLFSKRSELEPFVYCDVTQYDMLARIALEAGCTQIIHLASLLSAIGERNPSLAKKVNILGTQNVLEVAKDNDIKVYIPSSIAVFGPSTPPLLTPDDTIIRPTTIYGITKVYAELLGEYYHKRYGVDFRSLRYPGVISSQAMPGGGTTDYAVEIYHEALKKGSYECFLHEKTNLPMMYMPDCVDATIQIIEAPEETLKRRVYNLTGMSFTPDEIAEEITKFIPEFSCTYKPDFRQKIAETWPQSINDNSAREDWGWNHQYDITAMTVDMLNVLAEKYGQDRTFGKLKKKDDGTFTLCD